MRLSRLLLLLAALVLLVAIAAWFLLRVTPASQPAPVKSGEAAATVESSSVALVLPEIAPAIRESAVPADRESSAEIHKSSAPMIYGRVVRGGSNAPMSGMSVTCELLEMTERVLSGPLIIKDGMDLRLPAVDPEAAAKKHRAAPTRVTDAAGRFEFTDLVAGSAYTVSTETPAGMKAASLRAIQPSDEEVLIVVGTLYVAHLIATEENGAPLTAGDSQFLRYARDVQAGECAATEVARNAKERAHCDYTFVADCDLPRLGPFKVLVACPGYMREDYEFWAYPETASLGDTALRLHLMQGTGSLVVRQTCPCNEPVCAHMIRATVDLEPVQPGLLSRRFTLETLEREQRLKHIAVGIYRVRVQSLQGDFAYPQHEDPMEVEIGTGETELVLPVPRVGALRWKLCDRDSGPLQGYVRISGEGMHDIDIWSLFHGDDTEMRGLREGPHTFVLYAAQIENVEGGEWRSLKGLEHGTALNGEVRSSANDWELHVDVRAGVMNSVVVHGRGVAQSGR